MDGNVETGKGDDVGPGTDNGVETRYDRFMRPTKDLNRREMGKCALVGNARAGARVVLDDTRVPL